MPLVPWPINKTLEVKLVSPVPPSLTGTIPVEVKLWLASVKTKEETVRVATLTFPIDETVN